MKYPTTQLLISEFVSTSVDERFQITVGNATTIPQITLLSSVDWKGAKNGAKKGKIRGEKGRRNDDKRGTKGVRGSKKEVKRRGNDDKGGLECGSWAVIVTYPLTPSLPHLIVACFSAFITPSPSRWPDAWKEVSLCLFLFPGAQILVGGLNQS